MTASTADGLFLHASSVVVGGGAVLFLGHSTAGKSTIARMLGKEFPVLADDSVFAARGAGGGWRVVDGGFRFGEGDLADWQKRVRRQSEGEAVPLRGCLRIHKAEGVRVEKMPPVELARHLMDAAMEIDVQRKWGRLSGASKVEPEALASLLQMRRRWFGWAAEIARNCPGWHLWFSKETQLAELRGMLASLGPAGASPA